MVIPTGIIIPPPKPCRHRHIIIIVKLGDKAQNNEPKPNKEVAIINMHLSPYLAPNQLLMGIEIAKEIKKLLLIQLVLARGTWK
jgi:hypothetical protein